MKRHGSVVQQWCPGAAECYKGLGACFLSCIEGFLMFFVFFLIQLYWGITEVRQLHIFSVRHLKCGHMHTPSRVHQHHNQGNKHSHHLHKFPCSFCFVILMFSFYLKCGTSEIRKKCFTKLRECLWNLKIIYQILFFKKVSFFPDA